MSDSASAAGCVPDSALYSALPELLLPWYRRCARALPWREDREPYHVWLSEIMLQQTRVEAVKGYYARFLKALPDVQALAQAEEAQLLKLWEGLGYYNRARNLQKCAQQIVARKGEFPKTAEELKQLPGIGDYTAGAIASICFEQPAPAVDGNVLRVAARVTADEACVDLPQTKKRIANALKDVYPAGECGDFTQALMELGATVCVPNGAPHCGVCPLQEICLAKRREWTSRLPVRAPKRSRRIEERTVFLLECGGRYAIRKRPNGGLLAGLWEFPNVSGTLPEQQAASAAEQWGAAPDGLRRKVTRTHIFTHVEWRMTGYLFSCQSAAPQFDWAAPQQLAGHYALPSAFQLFYDVLGLQNS